MLIGRIGFFRFEAIVLAVVLWENYDGGILLGGLAKMVLGNNI